MSAKLGVAQVGIRGAALGRNAAQPPGHLVEAAFNRGAKSIEGVDQRVTGRQSEKGPVRSPLSPAALPLVEPGDLAVHPAAELPRDEGPIDFRNVRCGRQQYLVVDVKQFTQGMINLAHLALGLALDRFEDPGAKSLEVLTPNVDDLGWR